MLVLDQHFASNFFVQYWSMLILIKLLIIFLCKFVCGLCKVNFFEQCWPRQIKITLHRLFSCNKVPVYCGEKWRKVSLYLISPSQCTLAQRKYFFFLIILKDLRELLLVLVIFALQQKISKKQQQEQQQSWEIKFVVKRIMPLIHEKTASSCKLCHVSHKIG